MTERTVTRLNLAGFAAFCLAYLGLKLAAISAAHYDYAKELYNAQALRWVYEAANPPLYTWLLHGLSRVMGRGVEAVLVLNHALLFAVLVAAFSLGRRLHGTAGGGALAAWLLLTLHQIFRFQFARTHSLLLVLFVLLALLAFAAAMREGRSRDHLLLGLALGAGLLAKFAFAGFIGALVLGALLMPEGRRALATPRIALALLALLAVVLPVALAGLDQWTALAEIFKMKTAPATPPDGLTSRWAALLSLAEALLHFAFVPLLAMAAAAALGRMRRRAAIAASDMPGDPAVPRLLVAVMLAGIAILLAGVLSGTVARVSGRFLLAFLLPLPLVIAAYAVRAAPSPAGARYCAVAIALVLASQAAIRALDLSPYCSGRCTDLAPYDRLGERLAALGLAGAAATTDDVVVAGNLVAALPGSAVALRAARRMTRRSPPSRARCLVIWRADASKAATPPPDLIDASGLAPREALARARLVAVPWRWASRDRFRPFATGARRVSTWGVIALRRGEGSCR